MSNIRPMSFLSTAAFWGVIIVLIGLSIILREVFHVNIPFVRIIFGVLLIYWGVKIISNGFYPKIIRQSWRSSGWPKFLNDGAICPPTEVVPEQT